MENTEKPMSKRALTWASKTPEEKEAISKKLRERAAARTPEQEAERIRKRLESRSKWTPERKSESEMKRQASLASRTEAEKQESSKRMREAHARRSPEAEAERVRKRLEKMPPLEGERLEHRKEALREAHARHTPEQKEEIAQKISKSHFIRSEEDEAARVDKISHTLMSRSEEEKAEWSEKVSDTMMERYGTTSAWIVAKGKGTTAECKVRAFFATLGFNMEENTSVCAPYHLDGYDAEKKTAFEYHGLFWHCEGSKKSRPPRYHYSKLLACRRAGARLFSIFEDEWKLRGDQVRGYLTATLGRNPVKVFARKTEVRTIDDKVAQEFYEAFHIQGGTNKGLHSAGLFLGEDLVAAMTFGRHHRNAEGVVLTRLCFKAGTTVTGGASKLFKFLTEQSGAQEVISWSDNRWSEGGVYSAMGFVKDEELNPDYAYVDLKRPTKRIPKQSQKKGVSECPEGMTEKAWAKTRGLSRIWDCGKIRWKWKRTP